MTVGGGSVGPFVDTRGGRSSGVGLARGLGICGGRYKLEGPPNLDGGYSCCGWMKWPLSLLSNFGTLWRFFFF